MNWGILFEVYRKLNLVGRRKTLGVNKTSVYLISKWDDKTPGEHHLECVRYYYQISQDITKHIGRQMARVN